MKEYVDFLGSQPPYDALDAEDLERLARSVEVEYFEPGMALATEGSAPLDCLYVIRTGAVEVLAGGHVLDLLTKGDTFGHVSLRSRQPLAFTAVAVEDVLCYRLPDPTTVLRHPEQLLFENYGRLLTRTHTTDQVGRLDKGSGLVSRYVRPVVWCDATTRVREAAERISAAGQSCALVRLPEGSYGVVTDHDFRSQVASGRLSPEASVSELATAPMVSVSDRSSVAVAFLTMLERGVHHLVVTDERAQPVGIVRVVDLASAEVRDPLLVRAAVDSATSLDELTAACRSISPTLVELHDAKVSATHIGSILAAVMDAALRKLLEVELRAGRWPDVACSWLVLGSLARKEPLPDSDVDTALVWVDPAGVPPEQLRGAAAGVLANMETCGLRSCPDGANASSPVFSRSLADWARSARWWQEQSGGNALLLTAMMADCRPVTDLAVGRRLTAALTRAPRTRDFLEAMSTLALSRRTPTGFVRDFVVEHSGERRGQLDLKRGGLRPITSIAAWLSLICGDNRGTTPERIRRACEAGLLTDDERDMLIGSFDLVYGLLLTQGVETIRSGGRFSAYISPGELDPLTRRYLRDAFRAISHVQASLAGHWIERMS